MRCYGKTRASNSATYAIIQLVAAFAACLLVSSLAVCRQAPRVIIGAVVQHNIQEAVSTPWGKVGCILICIQSSDIPHTFAYVDVLTRLCIEAWLS